MEDTSVQTAATDSGETQTNASEEANTVRAEEVATTESTDNNVSTVEVQPEEKEDTQFASKFAALSRKEKLVRQREAELQARQQELEARLQELETRDLRWKQLEQLKQEKPLEFLKEQGLSYEDLTNYVLNDGNPTEEQQRKQVINSLETKIKELQTKLEEEAEERKKYVEQVQQKELEKTINNFKGEISTFLTENKDKYELTSANATPEDIYQIISEYYQESNANGEGKILSIEEATEIAESYFEEQAKKLVQLKKVSSFIPRQEAEPKQTETRSEEAKTLENVHSSQIPTSGNKKLSQEEALMRAASLLKYTD